MKVRAIINFNDLKEGVPRKIGDEFEVTKDRQKYLLEHNAVEVVEEPIEELIIENESQRKPKKEKISQRIKNSKN